MRQTLVLQKGEVWLFSASAILLLVSLVFAPFGQTSAACDVKLRPQQESEAVNLARRIERIETGLLPPAVLKGETPARMRLADRMKFYKTPAVSIAVINNGRLEWPRGYGTLVAVRQ